MLRALVVAVGCAGVAFTPAPAAGAATQAVAAPAVQTGPAVAPAPRLPAVEVLADTRVRHDAYFGFGLGLGGGNLRPSGAGARGSLAVTALLRVGGRLTDRVALGALAVTSFGGSDAAVSGFSNLLVEALFFPIRGRGLGVTTALGVSSAWVRLPGADGVLMDRSTRAGGAFGLGVGYDFWLARRFNLGVWLRADGSAGGFGVRAAGTLGLGFAWY